MSTEETTQTPAKKTRGRKPGATPKKKAVAKKSGRKPKGKKKAAENKYISKAKEFGKTLISDWKNLALLFLVVEAALRLI